MKPHLITLYTICLILLGLQICDGFQKQKIHKELVLRTEYDKEVKLTGSQLEILVRLVKERGFTPEELKLIYSLRYGPIALSEIKNDEEQNKAMVVLMNRELIHQEKGLVKTTYKGDEFLDK